MIELERLRTIEELASDNLASQTALVRLDLNLPLTNGRVADDFRLERSLPTLRWLSERGAASILMSHLGDDGRLSLRPVAEALRQFLPVTFVPDWQDWLAGGRRQLPPGSLWLFDNLRQAPEEMAGDESFAERLAAQGDFFVNEAFAVSHRDHASITRLPKLLPAYAGLNFVAEVKNLSQLFAPKKPFVVILGGAKFGTKLPLIERFLDIADTIFIYGALANAFFRRLGLETGRSLVDDAASITDQLLNHPKIELPIDVRARRGERVSIKSFRAVEREDSILDIGLGSVEAAMQKISTARTILWNGPVGLFEKGFSGGTKAIAKLVTASPARTVLGGGDTIAAVGSLGLLDQFNFVSTGGGAMLDFLAKGTLPGIEALVGAPQG